MPEYIELPQIRLKVRDAFSMNDLVKNMTEWLKENYYVDQDETGNENSQEAFYAHALRRGGAFLDAWMWWRLIRYPRETNKDTAYLRYRMNIDVHFLGDPNEIEMMQRGKKVKVTKIEVEFFINSSLEIDFRDEWKKGKLLGLVKSIFMGKIYRKEIQEHYAFLYDDTYRFQNMVKQFFKLETTYPPETVSQPPKGYLS